MACRNKIDKMLPQYFFHQAKALHHHPRHSGSVCGSVLWTYDQEEERIKTVKIKNIESEKKTL